jgi:hypothetical protein
MKKILVLFVTFTILAVSFFIVPTYAEEEVPKPNINSTPYEY